MLTIRRKQMDILQHTAKDNFRKRLMTMLRKELPEQTQTFDDKALYDFILHSEQRASVYKIKTERGIAKWSALALLSGPAFDEEPKIKAFLRTDTLSPAQKMDYLMRGTRDECARKGSVFD